MMPSWYESTVIDGALMESLLWPGLPVLIFSLHFALTSHIPPWCVLSLLFSHRAPCKPLSRFHAPCTPLFRLLLPVFPPPSLPSVSFSSLLPPPPPFHWCEPLFFQGSPPTPLCPRDINKAVVFKDFVSSSTYFSWVESCKLELLSQRP